MLKQCDCIFGSKEKSIKYISEILHNDLCYNSFRSIKTVCA